MRLSSFLYKLARTTNTISTLSSGNPKRINRRISNIAKGKVLGKMGFWRKLWS